MGLFSKIFGQNTVQDITLNSPINGEMINISEIPDPTFAESILGPTICIKPSEGIVYSPCDGVVSQIFRTAHAVTLTSNDKAEVLIHVGINTVDLKGEGFEALVKDDEQVVKGQPLIKFDIDLIASKGFSTLVPVVVCNAMDFESVNLLNESLPKAVNNNDEVIKINPKDA